MKQLIFAVLLLTLLNELNGQQKTASKNISAEANNYYNQKDYKAASDAFLKVITLADFKKQKQSAAYNAACAFALQQKVDSAFVLLQLAIHYGYTNKSHLLSDSDLQILHGSRKWQELLNTIPESKILNDNPELVNIVTTDINHFWDAYEKVQLEPQNARNIFKELYFDKASDGMSDYMGAKVSSIDFFIEHITLHPNLYKTIRENTLKVNNYKKEIMESLIDFKLLYPEAKFPDIYFVMGAFTSAGTVSPSGLLIGVNQISDGANVNTDELDFNNKLLMNQSKYLPNIVIHELIHFQQYKMKRDTTVLKYAIEEGMADFLSELVNPNREIAIEKIFEWVKGKEKVIWESFKEDMNFNRRSNWIANYGDASEDRCPDLGHWIGYEICKSYYENASNKKQAISDMLNIQDYPKFLKNSKWEDKIEREY